ncbi:hypothetical protein [Sphingomonas prati]|nr:hypothetical protein [Sphingomonas prati]
MTRVPADEADAIRCWNCAIRSGDRRAVVPEGLVAPTGDAS